MRRIPAKIISPGLQLFIKHYFKKVRPYSYKGLDFKVFPTVFFPQFTMSTTMLVNFLMQKELRNKTLLELGCGTGIISVFSAKQGAEVTATDINPEAIKNAQHNAQLNGVKLKLITSDLFTNLNKTSFDFIIINPPYYPKKPSNPKEEAWYCGEHFEYFERLFLQLSDYISNTTSCFMVLSEDCAFEKIEAIAKKERFQFSEIEKKRKWGEWTTIYQLTKHSSHA